MVQLVDNDTKELFFKVCQCAEDKAHNNRLKFANIPSEFEKLTVNSFDTKCYSTAISNDLAAKAKTMVANYIKGFEEFEELGKGLYFYSEVRGSGKTRLAVSLGNVLLNTVRRQVKFITSIDLLKEIKSTYNKETEYTESQILDGINQVTVLIIDDIGVEKPNAWVNEILFSIFDNRMKHKKITIFTSNCRIEELNHDERLKSRLNKMCIPVKMPDEDIRKAFAKTENEILQERLLGIDKEG